MTINDEFARLLPRVEIDLEAINNAWGALERVNHCGRCQADGLALLLHFSARTVDSARYAIENRRMADQLAEARESAANLRAAIRAALSAAADGEHDPLWFLRDEYTAQRNSAPHRERR
ncbi:hypothetical protein [Streptomyces sp. NBC_01803]|uniref:hypothetical protein n=1 Tax=Streptomyces sp. NBC_01803 TaxID=2975946 RepID=UPI002DDB6673|nr:hypothetical protein [Streptomyces sp. NBC_01803]WSA45744.1 hypothetical protein OIE51_16955 [Streptomyces sp. NBC_01803]